MTAFAMPMISIPRNFTKAITFLMHTNNKEEQ
jgi:hypothetical protein